MKKHIKFTMLILLTFSLVFTLCGCGGESLEEYMNSNEDTKKEIIENTEAVKSSIYDINVSFEDNSMIYEFKMKSQWTEESSKELAKELEKQKKTYTEKNKAESLSQLTGNDDVTVIYRYVNKDGSFIWKCEINTGGLVE